MAKARAIGEDKGRVQAYLIGADGGPGPLSVAGINTVGGIIGH